MTSHALVVMPLGKITGYDGNPTDFNAIYKDLLKPAIEAAGFKVYRAEAEQVSGDVKADLFQELCFADLVVVDLTMDNPDVWYQLGVRHALRARGVFLIQGFRDEQPLALNSGDKFHYRLKNGIPDPGTLEIEKSALTNLIRSKWVTTHDCKTSPVYQLLPDLQEPAWQSLRVPSARKFWAAYDAWRERIEQALQNNHIGDLLVLAKEAPGAAFRAEAHIKAGIALRKAECFDFALEQVDAGLADDPDNLDGLHERGICLQKLALQGKASIPQYEVRLHYISTLKSYPNDQKTWTLLARVDQDAWVQSWRQPGKTIEQMRSEAACQDSRLRAAIESYRHAFRINPGHFSSGMNALTLMHVFLFLTGDSRFFIEAKAIAGAVHYAAEFGAEPSFKSRATLGDLEILLGTPETVTSVYKEAIVKSEKDWFALNSKLSQLYLLRDLVFRPQAVAAGITLFEQTLAQFKKPEEQWQPRQVFLFSGTTVDAKDRTEFHFPNDKADIVVEKFADVLAALGASEKDLALTMGAAGGDILFAEACVKRGVRTQLLQPFSEAEVMEQFIQSFAQGESWRKRYFALKARLKNLPRSMPDALGDMSKDDMSPYERCNRWLLYTALAYGIEKVHYICLWDGGDAMGQGGSDQLFREVNKRTGQVTLLDINKLW